LKPIRSAFAGMPMSLNQRSTQTTNVDRIGA